ncbi:acyl carrier protein [Chitinophaga polysaccharea]|uniref:acyl carrier protein n=1 Tax=Chitinophaga TaxID=79328 RepID=UPI001455562E|nr:MULTISPECIES: acyl carrier protein [Chitinophaga]NLR58395.1 acyl carrier protein [Chitinophaga polysaccharea]NLU90922.1 acyl carrier protein [Chitinophaga sp. Ak27]
MDQATFIAELREIVKPYAKNQEALAQISLATDFINDLKINSANLVDVVLDVEEKYDIVIQNEEMERMLNVQAAMDIVNAKLQEK